MIYLKIFIIILTSYHVHGQSITFNVVDKKTKAPLPRATILCLKLKDSTVKKGYYSDENGKLTIPEEIHNLYAHYKFSYVGYKDTILQLVPALIQSKQIDIELSQNNSTFPDVVVEANRSAMQMSAGKKIVHVDETIAAGGGTAIDVLQTLPGITVDTDGNVALRGNSSVTLMIDNKPIRLYGDASQVLKNLPAHVIENVEIVTNPGAKYDAEGQSGIVNIQLKKKKEPGFNSTINAVLGSIDNYGLSAQCNSNIEGWNIFYGGDITRGKHNRITKVQTQFFDDKEIISNTTRLGFQNNFNEYGGLRLGADINVLGNDIITLSSDIRSSITTIDMPNRAIVNQNLTTTPVSYFSTESKTTLPFLIGSAGIIHKHISEDKRFEISSEITYFPTSFAQEAQFMNTQTDNSFVKLPQTTSSIYSTNLEGISHSWLFQSDILFSLNDTTKIEFGVKSYLEGIKSNFSFLRFDNLRQQFITDRIQSTTANHQDNIHAAYITFHSSVDNIQYQLGFRTEYTTNAMSNFLQNNNDSLNFSRQFIDVFPSISLSYPFSEYSSLQVSYSKRIHRPEGPLLNPFLDKTDSLIWRTGNPQLMPEYTQSFEFGFLYQSDFGLINNELFARFTDNVINPRFREKVNNIVIIERPMNIGRTINYGVQIGSVIDMMKEIKFNADLSLFYQKTEARDNGVAYLQQSYAWMGKLITTYILSENTVFQLYAEYTSPIVVTQGKRFEFSFANFAIKQNLYEKTLSLSFNWIDFLNTARFGGSVAGTNFSTELQNRRDFTYMTATLSYRINEAPTNNKRKGNEGGGGLIGGGNTM